MSVDHGRLKQILAEAAMKESVAARATYLECSCQGDAELRAEVERLLIAHDQAGDFLEISVLPRTEEPLGEAPGTTIGRYKLLEQIGEGGFGVVFMAEQMEPIRRRVALKIVKPGMDTKQVIARFEAERQALAMMDHPNIAKIFDAGVTGDPSPSSPAAHYGRPYFVMELVHGVPVTEFCDANQLSPRERLKLFLNISEAVQHAHQKGIIHRDLKPSNILVTLHDGRPVPKVIDFGTAKALAQPLTERTLFTAYGKLVGTPQYMSPEQAEMSGLDVDTRADIYSLGVLLYELLTGTTPFENDRLRTAAFGEMMRIIREEEPPKPSTRVSTLGARATRIARHRQVDPDLLRRTLRGDLDWILMKALDKDRSRRYQAASALAEDLQRHLDHQPVLAGPPGAAYRARKFIRRHRVGVAVAATVTTALVAGLFLATIGFVRASRESTRAHSAEKRAETHRQESEAVLRRLEIRRARDYFAQDRTADGVALLALLLRQEPSDRAVAEWLLNTLTHSSFALPATAPLRLDAAVSMVRFSPDGLRLLTVSRDNSAQVWDAASGAPLSPGIRHDQDVARDAAFSYSIHPLYADFSPEGERVVTASGDHVARIWSATNGQPLTPPILHPNHVTWAAFSPDGKLVATACKDGVARLWNAADGAPVGAPMTHAEWVNTVEFSPDGALLLTAADNQSARLWEIPSGKPVGRPFRHGHEVRSARFSPDGRRIVTASADYTARVWDAQTGEPLTDPMPHKGVVVTACFSPDGTKVATASIDNTARVWDGFNGQPVTPPLQHAVPVRCVRFSPDGQRIITASEDKTARIWDAFTGEPLCEPLPHHDRLWWAEFSPDGRRVATASSDNTVQVWDALPGQAAGHTLPSGNRVASAHWTADGRRLLVVAGHYTRVWNPATGVPLHRDPVLAHQWGVRCANFSPDGQHVVAALEDGSARVWLGTGERAFSRNLKHDGPVNFAEFSPDGQWVATASADGTARIWEWKKGRPLGLPIRHGASVWMARFSPDSKILATASKDKTARLWRLADGAPMSQPLRHDGEVVGVHFSPDGRHLVTASRDHSAQVWRVADGQPVGPRLRHTAPLASARFSPDGRWVVTASSDNTARVWESLTGKPVGEPLVSSGQVSWAEFSPDSRWVLTASVDGRVSFWNSASGVPLGPPLQHAKQANSAEFSPDGRWVATASTDGTALIRELIQAPAPAPAWLPELAEAVAGERLTSQHITEDVPAERFLELKRQLAESPGEDSYSRWLRWFLADRSQRQISPSAQETVPEHNENLLSLSRLATMHYPNAGWLPRRLAEANRLEPTNGVVLAKTAFALARFFLTNELRQLPALDLATRQALANAPNYSLSWCARALYLAKAGQTNAALETISRGEPFAQDDPLFWLGWGELLEAAGRFEDAYQKFVKAADVVENGEFPENDQIAWQPKWIADRHPDLMATHGSEFTARFAARIPARAPDCPSHLIDLDSHSAYWVPLGKFSRVSDPSRQTLEPLGHGRTMLGGVEFDLRLVMPLRSAGLDPKVELVPKGASISINRSCGRLHFLCATDVPEAEGTPVATCTIHYAGGQTCDVPIVYGRDIMAWRSEEDPPQRERPILAWRHDAGGGITLQLYRFTWENPRPEAAIESLDFVSLMTRAAPFLVALTAE